MNIPITKPFLGEEELEALKGPLATGWLTQGAWVQTFEQRFAAVVGADRAVSCSSCTAALHLALVALGIGPGDEVVVPSFTFVASANAVEYTGARPVFADIDLDTFNTTVEHVVKATSSRTRAIMPVHLFGLAADVQPMLDVARDRGWYVIEDAACAIGARYHGATPGTLGDVGCFSFHARKVITTGEGGMLVARDPRVAERAAMLRSHSAAVSALERHESKSFALPSYDRVGFNYRMTDVQAAIGVAQLGRLESLVCNRRRLARRYTEGLTGLRGIRLPSEPSGRVHAYQSYVIVVTDEARVSRDALAAELAEQGIATRQGTHAVHLLGAYASKYGLRADSFPNALRADRQSLALPLYPQMTEDEQEYVIARILTALGAP